MIRLEGFAKRYGKVEAVKALDLEITAGESFALLGPNGGGKTTIIRALVGLHAPSAGRILVGGVDCAKAPDQVKAQLSYVPQRVTMPEMLTAREVLTLFARLKQAPATRIDQVLAELVLTDAADRYIRELSGGMLQRLGLAVALLSQDVPLLVLDEPTVNLDPLGIERLQQLLAERRAMGTTIIFSSHLLHSVMQMADRVAVLVEGALVTLEEVPMFQAFVTEKTTVRVVLDEITEAMVEAGQQAGASVTTRSRTQIEFTAAPRQRLQVIRAIEQAGGTIKEFHTETPDWEALIRKHFVAEGSLK